ncbi:MAG: hypothetical protein R2838_06590 [Caldilineaceae bacterium]
MRLFPVDLAEQSSIRAVVDRLRTEFSAIDVLVNNAPASIAPSAGSPVTGLKRPLPSTTWPRSCCRSCCWTGCGLPSGTHRQRHLRTLHGRRHRL